MHKLTSIKNSTARLLPTNTVHRYLLVFGAGILFCLLLVMVFTDFKPFTMVQNANKLSDSNSQEDLNSTEGKVEDRNATEAKDQPKETPISNSSMNSQPAQQPTEYIEKPICIGTSPDVKGVEQNERIEVSTFATPDYTKIEWSGGGTFWSKTGSTVFWESGEPGSFTLTSKHTTRGGECSDSLSVEVLDKNLIYGIKSISMGELLSDEFKNGRWHLKGQVKYLKADGLWVSARNYKVPVSASYTIYQSNDQKQKLKTYYSGELNDFDLKNVEVGRNFEIPIYAPTLDTDYQSGVTRYLIMDITIKTPKQGSFTTSSRAILVK